MDLKRKQEEDKDAADLAELITDEDEAKQERAARVRQEEDEGEWMTECFRREDAEARRQMAEYEAAQYKDWENWEVLDHEPSP